MKLQKERKKLEIRMESFEQEFEALCVKHDVEIGFKRLMNDTFFLTVSNGYELGPNFVINEDCKILQETKLEDSVKYLEILESRRKFRNRWTLLRESIDNWHEDMANYSSGRKSSRRISTVRNQIVKIWNEITENVDNAEPNAFGGWWLENQLGLRDKYSQPKKREWEDEN